MSTSTAALGRRPAHAYHIGIPVCLSLTGCQPAGLHMACSYTPTSPLACVLTEVFTCLPGCHHCCPRSQAAGQGPDGGRTWLAEWRPEAAKVSAAVMTLLRAKYYAGPSKTQSSCCSWARGYAVRHCCSWAVARPMVQAQHQRTAWLCVVSLSSPRRMHISRIMSPAVDNQMSITFSFRCPDAAATVGFACSLPAFKTQASRQPDTALIVATTRLTSGQQAPLQL